MRIQVNEIKDSGINEVVSFHNINYGDKRTPKQWIWEYKGNYPDRFVFTVIKDDDRVIGTQGMIPIYLNIKGKTYLSGKSENSLLNRKYRGRKLFKELYDFAMSLCKAKKMCCVWGFTTAIKVMKKLQFSVYEDMMYTSILILSPHRFISSEILKSRQSMVRKIAESIFSILLYLYSSTRRFTYEHQKRIKRTSREFIIEQKLRSVSDLGRLYKRLRKKHADLIHIEQDEKYITWRIFNNPNLKYTTYFVYEDDLLRAYCYVNIDNKKTAHITDLTFEGYEAGDFLLKTILNNLSHNRNVAHALFMGNIKNSIMASVFDLLKKYGFIKRRSPASFVLRNLSYNCEKCLHDIKNWYVNGLWTEGYAW